MRYRTSGSPLHLTYCRFCCLRLLIANLSFSPCYDEVWADDPPATHLHPVATVMLVII